MKICEYIRSMSFLDLGQMSFAYENLTCFYQKPLALFSTECKAYKYKLIKTRQHNAGHMTKVAAMPIYGKIL